MFATKSSSPYPERKKKPRLKFAWNKNKAIDYDNCRQIDFFIQDVIEKAKEDYRRVYMDINGQCNNATGRYYMAAFHLSPFQGVYIHNGVCPFVCPQYVLLLFSQ